MFTASKSRRRSGFPLAVLFVCCLPAPAFSDEFQYLPDNVRVIASANVTTGVKTKTFQEFMKAVQAKGIEAQREEEQRLQNFVSKIGRITLGVGMATTEKVTATEEIEIATAIKTITIDEAKALKKTSGSFRKNVAFKEIKHGDITIYQETYQTQFGKDGKLSEVIEGEAFYVADGKYLVSSRQIPALKKVIDRNKPTMLSSAMQAGLKDAGFSNTVCVVVDLQNMPVREKADIFRMFGEFPTSADIKANVDKLQTLTVKINEPKGKFNLAATLTCKDKESAATVKTVGDKSLAFMKTKANEDPKTPLPDDFQKYVTGVRTALKAIQLSSAGARVTASLEVEPEIAVQAMTGWFFVVGMGGVKEKSDEKSKSPDKTPSK